MKKNTKIFFDLWVDEGMRLLAVENNRSKSGEINQACELYVKKNLSNWKELKDAYSDSKK